MNEYGGLEIADNIKKNYEEAKRIINMAQKNQQLVLFVGAGTSKDSGMPLWSDAVKTIATRLELDDIGKIDTLRIPQYYYNSRGKKEYTQLMREIFRAGDDLETNSIHKLLMRLNARTIVTTNYDHLIEKAAEENAEVLDVVSCDFDLPYRKGRKELIKIHGDFEHDNFVLREDDYLAYYRNFRLIENYIKSLIGTRVVLFVGYSFSDPDIKQIFDWAKDVLKDNFQRAYLIDVSKIYDPNEESYYKNIGINVMYSSIMLQDFEKYSHSERLSKMLEWLMEEKEISSLEQLYSELKPFCTLRYAYEKYINKAFRKIGLNCRDLCLSYWDGTNQSAVDVLHGIAYSIASENENSCYVYVAGKEKAIKLPDSFKCEETGKINAIVDILKRSAIESLTLDVPVSEDLPWEKNEIRVGEKHKIIVEIEHEDVPEWIEAIYKFDYKELEKIENRNDERLSVDSVELYKEQAYISYFRKRYLKAYYLLRTYSKLQYKKRNYAEYFFSETSRKYLGEYIYLNYGALKISLHDRDIVKKEIDSIDLDRTFRSLPDMGGENEVFKDLYKFDIIYSLFQESYIQSQKVHEQAQKRCRLLIGFPAFYRLNKKIKDFYNYEISNAVVLDDYTANREIYKLYFSSMLMSVFSPGRVESGDDIYDSNMTWQGIHASELSVFDVFIALRYMNVNELQGELIKYNRNLSFSDEVLNYIIVLVNNSSDEPEIYIGDRLISKIICLLGYSYLSKELANAVLKVICTSKLVITQRNNLNIISKFLVNIYNQNLYDDDNIKLLFGLIDNEIQYLGENKNLIKEHRAVLINGTYICNEFKQPYDKISYFKKMFSKETESICMECFFYFGKGIKTFLKKQYIGWECDISSYTDLMLYCVIVGASVLSPRKDVEYAIYEYCKKNKKKDSDFIIIGPGVEDLASNVLELYLQNKIADTDEFMNFIGLNGNEYQKWLINPVGYDYKKFKIEWLSNCKPKLLKKLSKYKVVKAGISKKIVSEYKKNGLKKEILNNFFDYFVV